MAFTRYLIAGLLLIVGARVSVAQQASEEDCQAWRNVREGRWIGDVTWIADWPGFGKKSDQVTAYIEVRSVADDNVLLGSFNGGNGAGHWIVMYDAGAREIQQVAANSGGGTGTCVISREEEQWRSRCAGSLADGSKTEGDYTLHLSDDGNVYRWSGTTMVGGEATDPLQDVWTRVGS